VTNPAITSMKHETQMQSLVMLFARNMTPSKLAFSHTILNLFSGSAEDWQTNSELFKSDIVSVMKHLSRKRSSKKNLLSAAFCLFWMLSNMQSSHLSNEEQLWSNFTKIISDFANSYMGSLKSGELDVMKTSINNFMSGLKANGPRLSQPNPQNVDVKSDGMLAYFTQTASDLDGEFLKKLKDFNDLAMSVPKAAQRAREKAELDEKAGGYDGDFTRVLDYLRGTVFIPVDLTTTEESLKRMYDKVIENLEKKIGKIERVKLFPMESLKEPPRILMNLRFTNNSKDVDLICEVQVRFALYGLDFEFQNFLHTVYELERKTQKQITWKPHVVGLTRDMLSKTGIVLNDDVLDWMKDSNFTQIDYTQGSSEDLDQFKIELLQCKGTRFEQKMELNFKVEYVMKKDRPVLVEGKKDQFQFQIRSKDIVGEMETDH
jgi:hypothetical protein